MHVSIFPEALGTELEARLPGAGAGEVEILARRTLNYTWTRDPFLVGFDRGRIVITTTVHGALEFLGTRSFSVRIMVAGEPIVTPVYRAVLQSTEVDVKAEGSFDIVNRTVEEHLKAQVEEALDGFSLDVRPLVEALHAQIARPIPIPMPDTMSSDALGTGCIELRIAAIEAGPTVLAGGVEKDLGVVVLPSVTLPCARTTTTTPPLPLLANVASIPTGPFTVVVPMAADYAELSRAMNDAIRGRLHFSTKYPNVYLEKPEVYAADERLVIRLVVGGTAPIAGADARLGGELYLHGHPQLLDNQITVPDLELTAASLDALLGLKILFDATSIRDQARRALRLDVSERLAAVRNKLSKELTFDNALGCARTELLRAEVTGIYPHQSFLRMVLTLSAQGSIYLPCRR